MDKGRVAAFVVSFLLLAASSAIAIEGPCKRDIEKHCSSVEPGKGRLLACFEEHKDSMSAKCVVWVEGIKASIAELNDVCGKDIASFCNFEQGDAIDVVNCLQGKYASLQADCRDMVHQIKYQYPQTPK